MTLISSPLLPLFVAAAGLPVLVRAFRVFDELVCHQRAAHPEAWTSDGKPQPFFSHGGVDWPQTFGSQTASRWLALAWLFQTPDWVDRDAEARRLIRRLRVFSALWNLCVVPLVLIALLVAVQADQRNRHATPTRTTTPAFKAPIETSIG